MPNYQRGIAIEVHELFAKYRLCIPKEAFDRAFEEIVDLGVDPMIDDTPGYVAFMRIFPLPGKDTIRDPTEHHLYLRCMLSRMLAGFAAYRSRKHGYPPKRVLLSSLIILLRKWLDAARPLLEINTTQEAELRWLTIENAFLRVLMDESEILRLEQKK